MTLYHNLQRREHTVHFYALPLHRKSKNKNIEDEYYDYDQDDYGTHYGDYAGSYAQDVAGYSDDVINDAFDGEPDAYWNID